MATLVLNMRKLKGSVQPNLVLMVRRMALSEAAPPSEPADGRRGHPVLVLSPGPAQPWEAEPRVSGVGEVGEPEVGPGVAVLAVVYPWG